MPHPNSREYRSLQVSRPIDRDTDRKVDATPRPYTWLKMRTVFLDDFGRIVRVDYKDGPRFVVHRWTRDDQQAFEVIGIYSSREESDEVLLSLE